MMNNTIVNVISEAWQTKRPELLKGILAENFAWHETPFGEPVTDKSALIEMWTNDIALQDNISVESDILLKDERTCVAHWRAVFDRNGKTVELDGIFFITNDENQKLTVFRQWWVTK